MWMCSVPPMLITLTRLNTVSATIVAAAEERPKAVEARFRSGIKISDADVKAYYEKNLAPEYAKRNVTPPKLETIQNRIEEVLLQQQVGALLQDWLKSLRAQGSVRMITPGEVTP